MNRFSVIATESHMRLVFFGSSEFAVPSLRKLANLPHEILCVVTQPDRPAGRGKKVVPTPVALMAESLGFPVRRCEDVNTPAFIEQMRALKPDLGVVIAFGQKLLGPLRSAFAMECVNLHASLLPKFRGAAPIAWAILAGETKTGVSVFRLVDRMDAGPIILQRETMIASTETCGELHDRLAGVGCDAIDATLKLHIQCAAEGGPRGTPQDDSLATQAPKLTKAHGYLDFTKSAELCARRCRAMWPWPGARCRYRARDGFETELLIASATPLPIPAIDPPGTLTSVLTVATSEGTLEIHSVQPTGKRLMSWQDFVNGRHCMAGDQLISLHT